MDRSIEAATDIRVAFARARQVFIDDPAAVFTEVHRVAGPRGNQFVAELSVDLGAGTSARQEVALQLGVSRSVQGRLEVPIEWHAVGHERLVPRFVGQLVLAEARPGTRLQLRGAYTVPLGPVGRFGDGVIGHRLARRSLDAFVQRLGSRLQAEVERRLAPRPSWRESRDWTGDEYDRSEIHVG